MRNLVNFTIFFPPFSGQIFSPMDSVGVSKLHLFLGGFLLRLQAAEAEPEEAGVWWVLLRVKSRVP